MMPGERTLEIQTTQDGNSLTVDQIAALCRRGFGSSFKIESIHPLGGGTFNTTYLITPVNQAKVVLRVSPPESADTYWDEAFLMRREHAMQPFFAPIAALMPKTLLVDFTHQLIERDYLFQTFIKGERWEDIVAELSPAENAALWAQFGKITKTIHNVQGEVFGLPLSGFQFASWSQTIIDRLERTLQAAHHGKLEIPHLASILDLLRSHPQQLEAVKIPRLLHGDLWLFNILISRGENAPAIVGILDSDRSWWGDPMADWTMFVLAHTEEEEGHAHFWQAYGRPESTGRARFREKIYDAMHAGTAFLWAVRHQDEETVERAKGTLHEVADALPSLL